jgi:two-component system, chemotaxis family, CheB/CheR fusion protein
LPPADPQFEMLLNYLKESRGFDFTGYKRASLMRRVDWRMGQIGVGAYSEYLDLLQVQPDEFTRLFNTVLINVTSFFRDPEAWEYLRTAILAPMVAGKPRNSAIRVWSAGCASGEEAYSLAMTLAEIIGVDQFRERVKIYATDVDEEQLNEARQATYTEEQIKAVPPPFVDRYFEPSGTGFVFGKALRRSVIFGPNNLIQDAPISRIDLLACRNTLMYFNSAAQAKILNRFHFALNDDGVLFLGKAELLLSHAALFKPIDLNRRMFRKVPRPIHARGAWSAGATYGVVKATALDQLRDEAFAVSPLAQLVVTADGTVALANRQLEKLFGVGPQDIGKPFRDLTLSYQPVELRSTIEQAQVERRVIRMIDVELVRAGEVVNLELQVTPLIDGGDNLLGVNVTFHDSTAARSLQDDLEQANRLLEAAYEELQSTNEELETTNEELQSTVEELETTNEELQSTNEELETMNEELQSTNDELQNINDQLRVRSAQLDDANTFLETVLTSLHAGVAAVDADQRIQVWNRRAEDLWGLRAGEVVGRHFLNLDIGLPIMQVQPLLRGALDGQAGEIDVEAVNRRGKAVQVRVACAPMSSSNGTNGNNGAVIIMEQHNGAMP